MSAPSARNLRDLSPAELKDWVFRQGHEPYRADQILHWLYLKRVHSAAEMKNLSPHLRLKLETDFSLGLPWETSRMTSQDGTIKILFLLSDGQRIETVAIPDRGRLTVCISSQVGCRFACRFCRTGAGGFCRQLHPSEIVGQLLRVEDSLGPADNLVFMGMGEPLDNPEALMTSLELLCEPKALGKSPSRITVSTLGLVEGIDMLSREGPPVNLAVSVHSVIEKTRQKLLPGAGRLDLLELRRALAGFPVKNRKLTVEAVLIAGVNDSIGEAEAMAEWVSGLKAMVNLIPYNVFDGSDFSAPEKESVLIYQEVLKRRGIKAFIRTSRGADILAACGQLRAST